MTLRGEVVRKLHNDNSYTVFHPIHKEELCHRNMLPVSKRSR